MPRICADHYEHRCVRDLRLVLGIRTQLPAELWVNKYMNSISLTIAAGSSQIQRNIISERILGLPKDR